MRLLAIASLLLSFSAVACPDLSGTYKMCKDNEGNVISTDLTVSKRVVNGVTIFTLQETDAETGIRDEAADLILDGVERSEIDEEGAKTFTAASCNASSVIVKAKFDDGMAVETKTMKVGKSLRSTHVSSEGETFSTICE